MTTVTRTLSDPSQQPAAVPAEAWTAYLDLHSAARRGALTPDADRRLQVIFGQYPVLREQW